MRSTLSILAITIAVAVIAQGSIAADVPPDSPAAAAPVSQRPQSALEILLRERARQQRMQAADAVNSSAQAQPNSLISAQKAAQAPVADGQTTPAPIGVPNNLGIGSAAMTAAPGADPSATSAPQTPAALERDSPAVSAEAKKLSVVPDSSKQSTSPPQH